jgi:tRNA U34 2-thiouridine synthase MnmA/TrmU
MARGIGIFSGGLDSLLSALLLRSLGVDVLLITFETPFFKAKRAKDLAMMVNFPLKIIDITEEHLDVVLRPKHGYGKNMNPCIDCHALMFRKAGQIMDEIGYDFLFSGEVLNERPFSQNRMALEIVARESGYGDKIVRPLSAKLLPETSPEKEGLVERDKLLSIQGRSRKEQIALARAFGIDKYPNPAGGCLLTVPNYSRRLKDLIENEINWTIRDLELLRLGRHLRIASHKKVIVGRNREENQKILALSHDEDIIIKSIEYPGPVLLVPNGAPQDILEMASAICLRYSDCPPGKEGKVMIKECKGGQRVIKSYPLSPEESSAFIID